jgi:hypothetical protein
LPAPARRQIAHHFVFVPGVGREGGAVERVAQKQDMLGAHVDGFVVALELGVSVYFIIFVKRYASV